MGGVGEAQLSLYQLALGSRVSHQGVKVGTENPESHWLEDKGTNLGQPQLPESVGRHLREEKDGGRAQILWINCPELPLISKPGKESS